MRQQHRVVLGDQPGGHMRFVLEHIEPCTQDRPRAQGFNESRLVNDAAARHVDQDALRPERLQHGGIDETLRLRAARRDNDQHVNRPSETDGAVVIGVGDVRCRLRP